MRLRAAESDPVRAIRANIARVSRGTERDLAAILRILDDAATRLRGRIDHGSPFDQARSRALLREVRNEMSRIQTLMRDPMQRIVRAPLDAGDADMLSQATRHVPSVALQQTQGLSLDLLDFASQNSAALIQQISGRALADIDGAIRQAATGSSTPADLSKELGSVLSGEGRPTGRFGTIATQTERVLRTETNRLYNAAGEARITRIAREAPGVVARKKWVATIDGRTRQAHRDLNGAVIAVSENFNFGAGKMWSKVSYEQAGRDGGVQGVRAAAPLDSTLPVREVANCRCGIAGVFG